MEIHKNGDCISLFLFLSLFLSLLIHKKLKYKNLVACGKGNKYSPNVELFL